MGGGFVQLQYLGSKNNIFIGNPEIQFFKKIYKSYINFAIKRKELSINSINYNFENFFNRKTYTELSIEGDLINKCYIKLDLDFHVKNFDLNIDIKEISINTDGKTSKIVINSINTNLTYGSKIKFNNIIYSGGEEYINTTNEYTIKTIEKIDNHQIITLFDIDNLLDISTNIQIYYLDISSNKNGLILEDTYNSNNKQINLYNYIYDINKIDNTLNISFYENINIEHSISEINITQNNILNLTNKSNKIIYVISKNNYTFKGEINIIILKENITKIIKEISYEIDEYIIEKHNLEWLLTYDKLFNTNDTKDIINNYIKFITTDLFNSNNLILYIPLRFSFNNDIQDSLPIASLYNSYNYIRFIINKIENTFITHKIIDTNLTKINDIKLLVNYIIIEPNNRNYFLKNKQKILINQVQYQYDTINNNIMKQIKLNFNYLSKIIIWNIEYKYILEYASFIFNKENITDNYEGEFYHLLQPLEYNLGNSNSFTKMKDNIDINGTYYIYSFSLYPNKMQPSGVCNLSRINDKILELKTNYINNNYNNNNKIHINIFNINYNYLIIYNGKGKLEYF